MRKALRDVGDIVRHDAQTSFSSVNSRSAAGFKTRVRQRGIAVEQSIRKTTGDHPEYGALQMRHLIRAQHDNEDDLEPRARAGDGQDQPRVRKAPLMDYIVIDGVPPYDGRWEWDLEGRELTTREWGWIKRLSGYLPLNIEEGLGDPELVIVFAAIALTPRRQSRAEGRPQVFERLSDAPFGERITLETDVERRG